MDGNAPRTYSNSNDLDAHLSRVSAPLPIDAGADRSSHFSEECPRLQMRDAANRA